MNYEDKKIRLRRYLIALNRLKTKCNEAASWEELSHSRGGIVVRRNRQASSAGLDVITETAETIQQEIEDLATEVNELRRQLTDALMQMPTELYRDVLEMTFIMGLSTKAIALKKNYSKGYVNTLLRKAINELEVCSRFF